MINWYHNRRCIRSSDEFSYTPFEPPDLVSIGTFSSSKCYTRYFRSNTTGGTVCLIYSRLVLFFLQEKYVPIVHLEFSRKYRAATRMQPAVISQMLYCHSHCITQYLLINSSTTFNRKGFRGVKKR